MIGARYQAKIDSTLISQTTRQTSTSNNSTTSKLPDTQNWKTYTNAKFGFSIKYPAGIPVYVPDTPVMPDNITIPLPQQIATDDTSEKNLLIIIRKSDMTADQNVQERIHQDNLYNTSGGKSNSKVLTLVGNKFQIFMQDFPSLKVIKLEYFIDRNGYLYQFNINTSYQNESQVEDLVNQILSTFKFTK